MTIRDEEPVAVTLLHDVGMPVDYGKWDKIPPK
jgi:hypothetical protein